MRVKYAKLNWLNQEAVNQSLFGGYGSESVVTLLVNRKRYACNIEEGEKFKKKNSNPIKNNGQERNWLIHVRLSRLMDE